MKFSCRWQWIAIAQFLFGGLACLGQQPSSSQASGENSTTQVEPRIEAKQPILATTPTDAEKIARLQRAIDESTRQVEELTLKLKDPASEFNQAESAFTELDRRLSVLKKALESNSESESPGKLELKRELAELEPKHALAKDRFDLAIRERKTLQEQIATHQKKIQQDTDAVKKLKGEKPPAATQPVTEAPPPTQAAIQVAPSRVSVAPAAPSADVPPTAGTSTLVGAPTPTGTVSVVSEKATTDKLTPELVEARQEASRKEGEAQSAQAELASVTERMIALRKGIELEQKQFETSRQKAENAQATERALHDALQKKWEEGASQSELSDLRRQITEARERLRETQNEIRDRTDRLNQYQTELSALQAEHIAAMEEAQKRILDAEQAQKRVEHLESPLSPRNLWRWLLERGPKVGGIIVAMFVLLLLSRLGEGRLVKLMARRGGQGSAEENRAKTLVAVVHSAATVAVYAGGGLMILTEVGINIVPLLGGAAVLGLAVAFGAQNLIRDYFYGFMILLENQYTINDVVKIGDVSGQVERITLRITLLRGLDGTVHFIPNGEITRVSNMTHEWSRALFDIPVAYKEDVDHVMRELVELAKELRRDPEFRGLILEMPEMLGVDEFADSAVIIKFLIKTRPLKQWVVKRELLRRIKRRFDELGIEIPFPHRTLYHRHENGEVKQSVSGSERFEQETRA